MMFIPKFRAGTKPLWALAMKSGRERLRGFTQTAVGILQSVFFKPSGRVAAASRITESSLPGSSPLAKNAPSIVVKPQRRGLPSKAQES
eukprot:2494929-Pyramimonas_sp.AAC.1